MTKNSYSKVPVLLPPADIILKLLSDDASPTDDDILRHYENYIRRTAVEPLYNRDGAFCGSFVNEDLMQELSLALVRSIPSLRRKVCNHLNGRCILLLVTPVRSKKNDTE